MEVERVRTQGDGACKGWSRLCHATEARQGIAQVEMGLGQIGRQRDGFFTVSNRRAVVADIKAGGTEVDAGFFLGPAQRQHPLIAGYSGFRIAAGAQQIAQFGVRGSRLRLVFGPGLGF